MRTTLALLALTVILATSPGCGGDDDPSPPGGDGDAGSSTELSAVTVEVTYDGDREGNLVVGAFLEDPPVSAPRAFRQMEAPTFPATAELRGLGPNTYYIVAVLDSEPASPTLPGPEDLTVTSDPLVVNGEPSHTVSLTLTDP